MRVPLLAGMCFVSALTGACAAMTAMPPWVMMGSAVILLSSALRGRAGVSRATQFAAPAGWFAVGALIALVLPTTVVHPQGEVLTRAPGAPLRGDLFDLLDRLDEDPSSLLGRHASVTGQWTPAHGRIDATVSRLVMSCCSADAVAVGFDVESARETRMRDATWVRVDGVLEETMRDGELRYVLEQSTLSALEDPFVPSR